jgi:putative phosphoribosyl transferase
MSMFADRTEAGRQLARALLHLRPDRPVVLALPRGGVPVGFEVARILEAPLDVLLVRKIGVPGYPELALGAVLDGEHPHLVLNRDLAELAGVDTDYIAEQEAIKLKEIEDRRALYLRGRPRPSVAGRTAIVVDDGVATGATMKAAIDALRDMAARRVVIAVPVAPPETAEMLSAIVDELVCLATPPTFRAVGQFYEIFEQTTDDEVIALLDQASALGFGQKSPGMDERQRRA